MGNTLHAGSKFEGDKEALEKKLEGIVFQCRTYRQKIGDLKLFFDIDGALPGQKTGEEKHQQLWCFETGNKYGINAGFTSNKSVDASHDISFDNDACSKHYACCKAEVNEG